MASVKGHLGKAKDALRRSEYREALVHCKEALALDKQCYEAYMYVIGMLDGMHQAPQAVEQSGLPGGVARSAGQHRPVHLVPPGPAALWARRPSTYKRLCRCRWHSWCSRGAARATGGVHGAERAASWLVLQPRAPALPPSQAEAAYRRAAEIDAKNPLAWQGLAELHSETGVRAAGPVQLFICRRTVVAGAGAGAHSHSHSHACISICMNHVDHPANAPSGTS
jgi:hypothetical protein